jgi:hypothetical protein
VLVRVPTVLERVRLVVEVVEMVDTYRRTPNRRGLIVGLVIAAVVIAAVVYFALYSGGGGSGGGGSGGGYAIFALGAGSLRSLVRRSRR